MLCDMKKLTRKVELVILRNILNVLDEYEKRRKVRRSIALKRLSGKNPSCVHRTLRRLHAFVLLNIRRKVNNDRKNVDARIVKLIHSLENRGFDKAAFLTVLKERNIDLSQYRSTDI